MLAGDADGQAWRNRIVGYGEEAPDNLLANPRNWRIHSKLQQEALAGVLNEVGWIQNVIVNRTTQHVLDGHLRITLAMRHGEPTVPVTYVELSEEEEALALATFDPIGALATAEKETLDALLRDVQTGEAAVQEMLAGLAAQESMEGYGRNSFDGLIEGLDDSVIGTRPENGNWFYVEYYADPETYGHLAELLKPYMRGAQSREIDPRVFVAMVESYAQTV